MIADGLVVLRLAGFLGLVCFFDFADSPAFRAAFQAASPALSFLGDRFFGADFNFFFIVVVCDAGCENVACCVH